ncbi:hypothetical protein [Vibrio metoecus]|uniref:capsular polysaccharide export protein, LipB/KpsS family n=1 Tax=Vibrio metoecus TaxID=1481663 RepID=UPI0006D7B5C8|nr:hypothetical protein [Vibrio metoecus]KQA17463.1 hypothetical protein AAY52_13890 [Vibrio metoecus]
MNVLIFDRPFTKSFFSNYKFIPDFEITRVSDFKWHGDYDIVSQQYKHLSISPIINDDISDDIIRRDRFLRNIDNDIAKRLVNSIWYVYETFLDLNRFDLVLGPPIDNYYLDILSRISDIKGIKNEFLIQSFLPSLTRISKRGEYRKVRTVSDGEVKEYVKHLTKPIFKPTTLKPHWSKFGLTKIYLKERLKKVYFETAKFLKRDPYSFHYNCIYPMKGAITVMGISNIDVRKNFIPYSQTIKLISDAKESGKHLVFLPLQFSPETTIDYYIEDNRFSFYDELIENVLNEIDDSVTIIVKEHPDIYGFRTPKFYGKFINRKNVHLVDVSISASALIGLVDTVLVTGGGSTGAEAVAKNRNVISLGDAYYEFNNMVHVIKDFDHVRLWKNYLKKANYSEDEVFSFVRYILENTLDGPYDFVRSKRVNKVRDLENIKNIYENILQK